jgi:hypothetical protein
MRTEPKWVRSFAEDYMLNGTLRAVGVAALALLSLAACTVNNQPPPAPVAPAPSPVVVTPSAPTSGTVVVQPKPY